MPNMNKPFSNCGNNLINMDIGKMIWWNFILIFVIVFSQKGRLRKIFPLGML